MTKREMYTYYGDNGVVTSPVLLEGAAHVTKIELHADSDKILRNKETGSELYSVIVSQSQVGLWEEVKKDEVD